MWAPDGTPADIVKKMSEELVKALNAPKVKQLWTSNGSSTHNITGEAFGKFVDAELIRWGKVAKQSQVPPQYALLRFTNNGCQAISPCSVAVYESGWTPD